MVDTHFLAEILGVDGDFLTHLKQPGIDADADAVHQGVGNADFAAGAARGSLGGIIGQVRGEQGRFLLIVAMVEDIGNRILYSIGYAPRPQIIYCHHLGIENRIQDFGLGAQRHRVVAFLKLLQKVRERAKQAFDSLLEH